MTVRVPDRYEKDLTTFTLILGELAAGRSNAVVTASLSTGVTTTIVTAPTCGAGSAPIPVPKTANAAAEIGNGTMYISAVANGSFTVTHANNAQADRTFMFVSIG